MCCDAAPHGAGAALAVVIGPDHKAVADEVKRVRPDAATFIQAERLGTAHAVLAAREAIARGADDLLVAFGDTPLISAETFARLRAPLEQGAALAVLGFRAADPTGYGRLLLEGDQLVAIREHADASARGAQGDAVQCRRDGVRRQPGAGDPRPDRKRQQQERVLSGRCRRHRQGNGIGGRRDRNQRGRSAWHQHQGAACGSGGGDAGAAAQGRTRCRRDADRAGDGLSRRRYQVRQATSRSSRSW